MVQSAFCALTSLKLLISIFKEWLITSNNHKDVIKTMFSGELYKYSYLYAGNFISDSCINLKIQSIAIGNPIIYNILSIFKNK